MGIISNLMYAVGFKISDRGLRETEDKVDKLKAGVIGFGLAAGAALAGFGVAAIHAASEFEKAMSSVQGATGQTTEQMQDTREIAKNLYSANFGENWDDLGQAISTVKQITGETGAALEATTKDALLLRDAFGFEVNESIRTADTMMQKFGINSQQAFSLLAQGAQKGLDKSGELLDSANEYAPQFAALGFTANEMFDTFSAGLESGAFNLDKVGDAVKEFNLRAKDGSQTTSDAFKMLGLDVDAMMQTFATGGPKAKAAFTQITRMISDVADPVAQNTIAVNLFGSQFEDLQKDVIFAMGTAQNQFDMTKQSMDEINKIKFDTPGQAFAMFGRQLETGILIPVGEKLLPYLTRFGQWMASHKPEIESFGAALGSTLGTAIDIVAGGLSFLAHNADVIIPALVAFAAVILYSLGPAMWAWVTVQWAAAVAGWAAIAPWLPIIGIALAVGAAVAGLILIFKNWGSIAPWLVDKWNWFKDATAAAFHAIGSFLAEYWPYALALITGPLAPLVMLVIYFWDDIQNFTVNCFTAISDFLSGIWDAIVADVTGQATSLWSAVTGMWDSVVSFFKSFSLFDIGKNIIQGLIDGVLNMKDMAVNTIKDIASGITDGIKGFLGIHSPSRVMMEVGYWTGEGLAQGIDSTGDTVSQASVGLAEQVIDPHDAPAASLPPATVSGGGGSNQRMQMQIDFNLNINASGNVSAEVMGEIEPTLKEMLQEVVESALRRLGLGVDVAYGND